MNDKVINMDSLTPEWSGNRIVETIICASITIPTLASCGGGTAHELMSDRELVDLVREARRTNELLGEVVKRLGTRGDGLSRVGNDQPRPQTPAPSELEQAPAPVREDLSQLSRSLPGELKGAAGLEAVQPKQTVAVAQSASQYEANEKEEARKHFLWTRRDVLAMYGYPDLTSSSGNRGTSWSYHLSEDRQSSLVFEFEDGLVVHHHVWRRAR